MISGALSRSWLKKEMEDSRAENATVELMVM